MTGSDNRSLSDCKIAREKKKEYICESGYFHILSLDCFYLFLSYLGHVYAASNRERKRCVVLIYVTRRRVHFMRQY